MKFEPSAGSRDATRTKQEQRAQPSLRGAGRVHRHCLAPTVSLVSNNAEQLTRYEWSPDMPCYGTGTRNTSHPPVHGIGIASPWRRTSRRECVARVWKRTALSVPALALGVCGYDNLDAHAPCTEPQHPARQASPRTGTPRRDQPSPSCHLREKDAGRGVRCPLVSRPYYSRPTHSHTPSFKVFRPSLDFPFMTPSPPANRRSCSARAQRSSGSHRTHLSRGRWSPCPTDP